MHDPCRCPHNRYKIRLINLLTARHVIGPTLVHNHYTIHRAYSVSPWQAYQWHPPQNCFYQGHWHKEFGTC